MHHPCGNMKPECPDIVAAETDSVAITIWNFNH